MFIDIPKLITPPLVMMDYVEMRISNPYQLACNDDRHFHSKVEELTKMLGKPKRGGSHWKQFKVRRSMGHGHTLKISYDPPKHSISFSIGLDMNLNLMLLHDIVGKDLNGYPKSLDGQWNYLTKNLIRTYPRAKLHKRQIKLLRKLVYKILKYYQFIIMGRQPSPDIFSSAVFHIEKLELYRDILCDNALFEARELIPHFQRIFKKHKIRKYRIKNLPDSYLTDLSFDGNSYCLTGQQYENEFHKIYSKLVGLLRLESVFDNKRIQRIRNSNRLIGLTVDEVDDFLTALVYQMVKQFSRIFDVPSIQDQPHLHDPLIKIMARCKTTEEITILLSSLIYHNRIDTKGFPRPTVIYQLKADGILKNVGTGLHALREPYDRILGDMKDLLAPDGTILT